MAACSFCGEEKTPIYCFGDGEPICHDCHGRLPNTIAACRREIIRLEQLVLPEGWRATPEVMTLGMKTAARIAQSRGATVYEMWDAIMAATPEPKR